MFNNTLLLMSGADIPFAPGSVTIHQPTIYELSFIGEEAFWTGIELLRFSKNILVNEVKNEVMNQPDFNILMSIIHDKSGSMAYQVSCAKSMLMLLFPTYRIRLSAQTIDFFNWESEEQMGALRADNFDAFKEIITAMFCLKTVAKEKDYNAQGELAKKIANKLKQRQQKLAELSIDKPQAVPAIFSKYISILTVGEHKDMNSFMKYTVYQLFDEFQRFQLKVASDAYYQACLAGAQNLTEPEDWTKDLSKDSD